MRLGIVGCGAVVREYHLPQLVRMSGVDIRVLCDSQPEVADQLRKEFDLSAEITDQVSQFDGRVDMALVATPPRSHAPVTTQLLEMGIDVLCEKPLATTVEEATALVETAKRNGRVLSVGLFSRFQPNNGLLRKLLRDDFLGEICEVTGESGAVLDWSMTSPSYYSRANTAGGVFFDAGVHLLDRILWLFGDLSEIEFEDDSYGGVEANAVLRGSLDFSGRRVPCRMAFSWTHKLDNCIRVVGTRATAELPLSQGDLLLIRQQVDGETMEMQMRSPKQNSHSAGGDIFRTQFENFVNAVRVRCDSVVPASSAIAAIGVIERAYAVRRRIAQPWVEGYEYV